MCYDCKHFIKSENTCKTFPNGIPYAIFLEYYDHRKPYDGDNGVLFAPKSKDSLERVKFIYGDA
ncbi:hypothetical protein Mahau_0698 [Mahella australiensis 50-1 BON]|uniref:Uncharacterized protein n=1 Tax=Mahella australiensis (strain DSM 15567 / CIP 107919 / 50-1 BON) TaxID=697281 RepID=F4A0M1_MAHA5|nr:hypothetical protein Mahau_0698 [Mahella australiensis 50-1 BON]